MKLSSGVRNIAVLGMKKDPCWGWNIFSLAHTGILHSSMQEMSSGLRSRIFAVQGGENPFLRQGLLSGPCRAFLHPYRPDKNSVLGVVFSPLKTAKIRRIWNFIQCKTARNFLCGRV